MKKRADGRYKRSILIGYTEEGKEKRKYVYGTSKKEVEQKISEIRMQLERGVYIEDKNLTVGEWADKWLDTYKTGVQYNTFEMYAHIINLYIKPEVGNLPLTKLKTHHIQNIINKYAAKGLTRTLQQIKLTMNQIIKQAINNDLLYKNVAENVILPQIDSRPKRSLTNDEKKLLEKADFTIKEKAFVYLLLYSGLRRGEALALTRNDIDFEKNVIRVNKTIIYKGNNAEIKNSPKTDAGNREIPILSNLKSILRDYIQSIQTIYSFTQNNGEIMSKSSFRRFWDGIMDKLNTAAGGRNYISRNKGENKVIAISQDITPHTFRHTYATMLYYAGVDIKTAQYLLGHSSIKVTMDIYTHIDKSQVKNTVSKLELFLNENKKIESQN